MKKIILPIIAAALVFAGCSEDESINHSNTRAIDFKTLEVQSKAAERGLTELQEDGFNVYAFYDDGKGVNYTTPYINDSPVEYTNPDWAYSPIKFWPTQGNLTFYAHNGLDWSVNATNESLDATATGGSDVLVAKTDAINTPNAKVIMHFHHALSQIVVSAKSGKESLVFSVSEIKLTNVLPDGKAELVGWSPATPNATTPEGNGLDWTAGGTATDYTLELSGDASAIKSSTSTSDYTDITDEDGGIMIIPQTLNDQTRSQLSVTYTAKDAETGVETIGGTTVSVSIEMEFLPGLKYRFNLTLNGTGSELKPIEFGDPTVETWVDADNSGIQL